MECPSVALAHRICDLLVDSPFEDICCIARIVENCNLFVSSEKYILLLIGWGKWELLPSFGFPAVNQVLKFISEVNALPESESKQEQLRILCSSIEYLNPVDIKIAQNSSEYWETVRNPVCKEITRIIQRIYSYTKSLYKCPSLQLSSLSSATHHNEDCETEKVTLCGYYKKLKNYSRILYKEKNVDVYGEERLCYLIGLQRWEEVSEQKERASKILFTFLDAVDLNEREEILTGIQFLDEAVKIKGLVCSLERDYSGPQICRFFEKCISWADVYCGNPPSRLILDLMYTSSFSSNVQKIDIDDREMIISLIWDLPKTHLLALLVILKKECPDLFSQLQSWAKLFPENQYSSVFNELNVIDWYHNRIDLSASADKEIITAGIKNVNKLMLSSESNLDISDDPELVSLLASVASLYPNLPLRWALPDIIDSLSIIIDNNRVVRYGIDGLLTMLKNVPEELLFSVIVSIWQENREFCSIVMEKAEQNSSAGKYDAIIEVILSPAFYAYTTYLDLLRRYSDLIIKWLKHELSEPTLVNFTKIISLLHALDQSAARESLYENSDKIFTLAAKGSLEDKKGIRKWYRIAFDQVIDGTYQPDNHGVTVLERIQKSASLWALCSVFSELLKRNQNYIDIEHYFTRKELAYYWIGIRSWRSVALFTNISSLVSPTFYRWLSIQLPRSTLSDLVAMAKILGDYSIEYTPGQVHLVQNNKLKGIPGWYQIYTWHQIGLAYIRSDHRCIDQFGTEIIQTIFEVFATGNEKEKGFLFKQILRYENLSLDGVRNEWIAIYKRWVIDHIEEFSYQVLIRVLKPLEYAYVEIERMITCRRLLLAIGKNATYQISNLCRECERSAAIVLRILPTVTPADQQKFLFSNIKDNLPESDVITAGFKFLASYVPPQYYLPSETPLSQCSYPEKLEHETLIQIIKTASLHPEVSAHDPKPNFPKLTKCLCDVVKRALGKELYPRPINELKSYCRLVMLFCSASDSSWITEQTTCFIIGTSRWDLLSQTGETGLLSLFKCVTKTKENDRIEFIPAFLALDKNRVHTFIGNQNRETGSEIIRAITNPKNPLELDVLFFETLELPTVSIHKGINPPLFTGFRSETGSWLNGLLSKEMTFSALQKAVTILDLLDWHLQGSIDQKNCYYLIRKNWGEVIKSGCIPEKIGDQEVSAYLRNEIQGVGDTDLVMISTLIWMSTHTNRRIFSLSPEKVKGFDNSVIPPLLSLLSSDNGPLVTRVCLILRENIGKGRVAKFVKDTIAFDPALVSHLYSDILVQTHDGVDLCLELFSGKDADVLVSPKPEAYRSWLREYIFPDSEWEKVVSALKVLNPYIPTVPGNPILSIRNLWPVVKELGNDALALYLRLLFSHDEILIERAIEILDKVELTEVTRFIVTHHGLMKMLFLDETSEKKSIQYLLNLLSQPGIIPILPLKQICIWFRQILRHCGWCELQITVQLIDRLCLIDPFIMDSDIKKYYVAGKREWVSINVLFAESPGLIVRYLPQAPEQDLSKLIEIVGKIGDPANINSLISYIDIPYPGIVRAAAIKAISSLIISSDASSRKKFLFKRLLMLSDGDPFIVKAVIQSLQPECDNDLQQEWLYDIVDCMISTLNNNHINGHLLIPSIMIDSRNDDAIDFIINLLSHTNLPRCDELYELLNKKGLNLLLLWLRQLKSKLPLLIGHILLIEDRLKFGCIDKGRSKPLDEE